MSRFNERFSELLVRLTSKTGLTFSSERLSYLEAVVRRVMAQSACKDLDDYLGRLAAKPELLHALISQVAIGETYFFRDLPQFAALRETILPDIAGRTGPEGEIHVWSAGCASGEEAYSLAIVLEELGLHRRSRVFGTDISRAAIERANRSVYGAWSFRNEFRSEDARYFDPQGKRWSIASRFRSRVSFVEHNLLEDLSTRLPASIDLILCRNVLLYFGRDAVVRAAGNFVRALAPGGWLVLGTADPLLPSEIGLEVVLTPAGVVYRRRNREPDPGGTPPRIDGASFRIEPPQPPPVAPVPDAAARARELASGGHREDAVAEVAAALAEHPLEIELHVLRSLLMPDLGRPRSKLLPPRATRCSWTAMLEVGHLALGKAFRLNGLPAPAGRALRRCSQLLEALPEDAPVRFGYGASAGNLAASAAAELRILDRVAGAMR